MSKLITISENTSINDINSWTDDIGNEVTFKLLYKSSFRVFAEGVGLGVLATLAEKGTTINIKFYKPPEISPNSHVDIVTLHPILRSLFGLELLRLSASIYDNKNSTLDIRSIIGEALWKHTLENKGILEGDNGRSYIVSRHGYEIPRYLRQDESTLSFPRSDYFFRAVATIILELRGHKLDLKSKSINDLLSSSEKKITEWLFHIAENSYSHGTYNPVTQNDDLEGYRGIILGKYCFLNEHELEKRKDLSDFTKECIRRIMKNPRFPKKNFVVSYFSVVDIGVGIQNTISEAGDLQALYKSFEDGISRRSTGGSTGYGLGSALRAASQLNSLFLMVSSNIATYIDFSNADSTNSNNKHLSELFEKQFNLNKTRGSSISMLWLADDKHGKK